MGGMRGLTEECKVARRGRVEVLAEVGGHDDARVQAVGLEVAVGELSGEGEGEEHVCGFGLAVGDPFVVCFVVLWWC